jgi:23S rRNA pseudouridine1911/1915/1917 synthase
MALPMARKRHIVSRADARKTVAEWLNRRLGLSWQQARQAVREGRVLLDDRPCRDSSRRLQQGQRLDVDPQPTRHSEKGPDRRKTPRPPREGDPVIRHADAQIVVVDKPAGLTTVRHAHEAAEFGDRGRRYLPATLADRLPRLLEEREGKRPSRVRAVHRLDRETSGLVVFSHTPEAERHLGKQFRAHTTERRYLALVRGKATDQTIESWLVADRGDGRRGSSGIHGEGQHAVTHVRVLEALGDYTLVECRLETGRTHQVRIHLGEAGTPLCGERVYDRPLNGRPVPDNSGAKRVALHAASLGFDHPTSGERVRWTSPLPADMKELLQQFRRATKKAKEPPERA